MTSGVIGNSGVMSDSGVIGNSGVIRAERGAVGTLQALSQRTGVPGYELQRYESLGLITPRGHSPSGRPLYGAEAVRCVGLVRALHRLGLTDDEIRQLVRKSYGRRLVGPELAAMLATVRHRTQTQIRELEQLSRRVGDFQRRHYVPA
jgi:DNA-binding transcriptional MerR regulator